MAEFRTIHTLAGLSAIGPEQRNPLAYGRGQDVQRLLYRPCHDRCGQGERIRRRVLWNAADLYRRRRFPSHHQNSATAPLIQTGSDSSSANPTITFSTAFKAATTPKIYCQVVNNGAGTMDMPEVYSVSNTGFTMRKKSFNGSAIGTANYTVQWWAIGENP